MDVIERWTAAILFVAGQGIAALIWGAKIGARVTELERDIARLETEIKRIEEHNLDVVGSCEHQHDDIFARLGRLENRSAGR